MKYTPCPIKTDDISLPNDILLLGEDLARNTHEVWAKRRILEGWTYGPHLDAAARTHPGLVPYEQLSEEEKEYDRATAMETLRLIVVLGYKVEKRQVDWEGSLP